jgi:hypothetical protein
VRRRHTGLLLGALVHAIDEFVESWVTNLPRHTDPRGSTVSP